MRFMKLLHFLPFLVLSFALQSKAQTVQTASHDGIVVLGYVDQGAYLNFTGPNIHSTSGHSKFILGMLPSLRIKADEGFTRNPLVTPSLGIGFTYAYKALALQLPLYFNPKTITQNGRWHLGLGLGVRLNNFNQK
jgi:hypothetical protein